jgi:DNA-binding MarR family transcriptional regulator/GNAT superfamily N-acetyltransferase
VIFELAHREPTELGDLRRALDLDAGYLSRLASSLETDGLVSRERSPADGRRQLIRLTEPGRDAFEVLDERSAREVRTLLSRLGEGDQRRLVGAMDTIQQLLEPAPGREPYVIRPPHPGDFGWVVARHGALYAEEYGWDEGFEALVARIVADYLDGRDPRREAAWIAELGGDPVGCVLCVAKEERVAQLRLLLVEPRARGMGIGSRLVEECVRFARRTGYHELTLWTNDPLVDARRVYERAGFELVEEEPHRSFGQDLVGQHWRLPLRDAARRGGARRSAS